jgi:hypothetical protein
MNTQRLPLVLSLVAACALSACKEPQKPADFSPEPGAQATAHAPAGGAIVNAPVELNFEQRKANVTAGGRCNIERANGTVFSGQPVPVSKASPMSLGGWIADVDAKSVPSAFDLRLVNTGDSRTWKLALHASDPRTDVQTLLGGDAAFATTGFAEEFDIANLPDGTYRAYLVFEKNGVAIACDNGRAIQVGP